MINNMGVRVAQVERKTLIRQIETPGFITAIRKASYTRYNAPAKGRIVKFYGDKGHWFEQGDPLIDIALDDLVLVQEKHLELLAKEQADKAKEDKTKQEKNQAETQEANNRAPELISNSDSAVSQQATDNLDKAANESDNAPLESPVNDAVSEPQDNQAIEPSAEMVPPQTSVQEPVQKPVQITTKKTRLLMKAAGMTDEQITELEKTKVTSPIITLYASHAGEIENLRVKLDQEVKSNSMLFALGGLMKATVLANAFQRDASWVKQGQEVDIVLPHSSNKPWKGLVSSGAVSININSQNIGIELVFTVPHDVVKTGMYVVGNIYGQVRKDTLTVPRDAIIYSRNEKRVIVALGKGRFKPVVVDTGISNDNEVEILKGLEEGDTVVVSAQFLIDSESSLQASYRRMSGVEP